MNHLLRRAPACLARRRRSGECYHSHTSRTSAQAAHLSRDPSPRCIQQMFPTTAAVAIRALSGSISMLASGPSDAGPTLAVKVRAACKELAISDGSLSVSEALRACNDAMGLEASGGLLAQADELVTQLGLNFGPPPPPLPPPPPPSPPPPVAGPRPASRQSASPAAQWPSMVVFDLDFTLWQPELYQLAGGSPFRRAGSGGKRGRLWIGTASKLLITARSRACCTRDSARLAPC